MRDLPAPAPYRRSPATVRAWNFILIVTELAVFAWITGMVAFLGFFVDAVVLECAPDCDTAAINTGTAVAVIGPVLIGVAAIALTIRRSIRRQRAWWIPLAALPVLIVPLIAGSLVAATMNLRPRYDS